jgi:hypothetical protein
MYSQETSGMVFQLKEEYADVLAMRFRMFFERLTPKKRPAPPAESAHDQEQGTLIELLVVVSQRS